MCIVDIVVISMKVRIVLSTPLNSNGSMRDKIYNFMAHGVISKWATNYPRTSILPCIDNRKILVSNRPKLHCLQAYINTYTMWMVFGGTTPTSIKLSILTAPSTIKYSLPLYFLY